MTTIDNLQAALFTRVVSVGEINPDGEALYDGYHRVTFAAIDENLQEITFPKAEKDYPLPVMCVAAINGRGKVVGVKLL